MAAFVPFILGGLSAAGGALGGRAKTQQQSGFSTTQQDQYSIPFLDIKERLFRDALINEMMWRGLEEMPYFGENLFAQGAYGINEASDIKRKLYENLLVSRGQGMNVAPLMGIEGSRLNELARLQASIPLQLEQMRQARAGQALQLLPMLPYATRQYGTTSTQQQGEVTTPGNILGGLFSGPAQMLALLAGSGYFKKGSSGPVYI